MSSSLTSSIMPRTTLDLDATVLADLRRRAAAESKSMGQVASERLARSLHTDASLEARPLNWATKDMGRFKIDLEDKDAVWRLLDSEVLERGAG